VTPELRTDVIRYRLAAPIREFAATRLDRLGERPDAEGAHLSFFAELRQQERGCDQRRTPACRARALKAENENFVRRSTWQRPVAIRGRSCWPGAACLLGGDRNSPSQPLIESLSATDCRIP